jgi:hypothetical protein
MQGGKSHAALSGIHLVMAKKIANLPASVRQRLLNKAKLIGATDTFEEIVTAVKLFLEPLATAIAERKAFNNIWTAPGPWR